MNNLFANIPIDLPAESLDTLVKADSIRIERIVSRGHASPNGFWYDQVQDEWVLLLSGAARLQFEDEPEAREMKVGDHVTIPAHARHRVEWTTPREATVWLAVHYTAAGQNPRI